MLKSGISYQYGATLCGKYFFCLKYIVPKVAMQGTILQRQQ